MAKHEHGTMKTADKEATFFGFVFYLKWAIVVIIATLILAAILGA